MDSNSYNLARPTHEIASICVCLLIFIKPELYLRWTGDGQEVDRNSGPHGQEMDSNSSGAKTGDGQEMDRNSGPYGQEMDSNSGAKTEDGQEKDRNSGPSGLEMDTISGDRLNLLSTSGPYGQPPVLVLVWLD